MKRKKVRLKTVGVLLIVWLASVSFSSCTTAPEIIVVKETILPQEIFFPEWPVFYEDEIDYSYDNAWVYIPEWLWLEIAEYQLDVKKTEELYFLFRQ